MFTILEMGSDTAKLEQRECDDCITATYAKLVGDWKLYTGRVYQVLKECPLGVCSPLMSKQWAVEAARVAVYVVLRQHCGTTEKLAFDCLELYQSASVVAHVVKQIRKTRLVLSPSTPRVDLTSSNGAFGVCKLHVNGQAAP